MAEFLSKLERSQPVQKVTTSFPVLMNAMPFFEYSIYIFTCVNYLYCIIKFQFIEERIEKLTQDKDFCDYFDVASKEFPTSDLYSMLRVF